MSEESEKTEDLSLGIGEEGVAIPSKLARRLSPQEWGEAEGLWAAGEMRRMDIAKKFKVSETAIAGHMKRHGVIRGSAAEAQKKKIAAAVTRAAIGDATITAARILETKEEHYKMSSAIAKMSFHEILEAKQNGLPVSTAMSNLKAYDACMTVLARARSERWAVLGLDKDDKEGPTDLPELLISELTAAQVEELRSRDFTGIEDVDVGALGGDEIDLSDDPAED
jgi:hypothetical protein